MTDFDPAAAAQAASEPGAFSFIDRLLGRAYPTSDVVVYLDEASAFHRIELVESLNHATSKEQAAIQKSIDEVDEKIAQSRYVFTLTAFPPEQYDAFIDEAYAEFPATYTYETNPFSGAKTKHEQPSAERLDLLNAKLWARSITKIVAPDGSTDESRFDEGSAANVRNNFPIDGRRRIDTRIQELRMASNWMDDIQDEGFLATR